MYQTKVYVNSVNRYIYCMDSHVDPTDSARLNL
jgi:hypothetical protein